MNIFSRIINKNEPKKLIKSIENMTIQDIFNELKTYINTENTISNLNDRFYELLQNILEREKLQVNENTIVITHFGKIIDNFETLQQYISRTSKYFENENEIYNFFISQLHLIKDKHNFSSDQIDTLEGIIISQNLDKLDLTRFINTYSSYEELKEIYNKR